MPSRAAYTEAPTARAGAKSPKSALDSRGTFRRAARGGVGSEQVAVPGRVGGMRFRACSIRRAAFTRS